MQFYIYIKEVSSNKSRVAKGLKADFRIACTGTPVENSLTDLWNIFDSLQHNLLGTQHEFKETYPSDGMTEDKYNEIRKRLFYEKPYAYVLRRDKRTDLKNVLPEKHINKPFKVPLTNEQIDKFEELKLQMQTLSDSNEKLKAFANMNKLSQYPRLLSNIDTNDVSTLISESNKFKKLLEIIEKEIKPKNEKVIIFCIFEIFKNI